MSRQYKDGKPYEPKPKAPKRKDAQVLVSEHYIALLRQKRNLIERNLADDFLDVEIRERMVSERAKNLRNLSPDELLIRLAKTELQLETTQFLFDEAYEQKQFLEAAYLKSGEKRLVNATNIAKGKVSRAYITAKQLLDGMKEKNFKIFCKKMRARLFDMNLSASSLRNYYLKITGKDSTK
jgi:hypothetical protein